MDAEDSELPRYLYKPLKCSTEIRVIALLPATTIHSKLEIPLTHVDRATIFLRNTDSPFYEAISYCWGGPILSHTLKCDDQTSLSITANVDLMLRHYRKTHSIRYLWVDAICLNQQDDMEKRIQVGLMGEIFHEAEKVHIWLGAGEDDATRTIFTIMRLVGISNTHALDMIKELQHVLMMVTFTCSKPSSPPVVHPTMGTPGSGPRP
jgi:hypothetical protein